MKRLSKKDLSEEISEKILLKKKNAEDIIELFILEWRDLSAESGYKTVKSRPPQIKRRSKKFEIPIIKKNEDDFVDTIAYGTSLGRRKAKKAIKIISQNIIDATEEDEIVEVEDVGFFKMAHPSAGTPRIIFQPLEPKEISFPDLDSSGDE
jgi:nucleoid DNA-binding protein